MSDTGLYSEFIDVIGGERSDNKLRQCKVATVAADSCTIYVAGSSVAVTAKSMIPLVANDIVWAYDLGYSWIVTNHIVDKWHVVGTTGEVAFQGTWAQYDVVNWPVQYRKVGGIVFVDGLAKHPTNAGVGTNVFILPVGYRPATSKMFTTMAAGTIARIDIPSTGGVNIAAAASTNDWVNLSSIRFVAQQ